MRNKTKIVLKKPQTQANQGSEINVISIRLIRILDIKLHALSDINFKDLSIRTADHRDTVLKY